jgi:hypothetical protein
MNRSIAFVLLLLAGCSSKTVLTRLDPAVTAADLRQGKVAVLGVVKAEEADQVRPPMIAMLEKTWREERSDVPLITADSVRQALGPARDKELLLGYEYHGKLEASALGEIANSLRGVARYVIVARVEKDKTWNVTRGISTKDTTSAQHVLYAMGVTGRDAWVTVQLYDLSRSALVVGARFKGSAESQHPMIDPRFANSGIILPKATADERGYPEMPDLALSVEQPFRDFARILPGSTKAPSAPPAKKG